MKSKLLYGFLLAIGWLTGTTVSAQAGLTTNEDGAYLIGSKEELQAWTKTAGYEKSNVILTADIEDVNFRLTTATAYTGTFDGGGHTLTLDYDFAGEQTAMFVNFAGTVRNIIVDGSINATYKNCAALVGTTSGASTFENTIVLTSINSNCGNNASNAAFIGYTKYPTTFTNCVSAYQVTGTDAYNHGFIGWIGSSAATTFNNCISIMQSELPNTMSFANPTGSISAKNCYSYQQNGDPDNALGGTAYTNVSALGSGEVCYLLNKGAGKTVFYQTLGEDSYPVPFDTHKQVYGNGNVRCDGTLLDGELTYSNVEETTVPPHVDVDGRCSVCNNLLPDHIAVDENGFYPLATAKDVEWFAALVNEAQLTTIKGKLTADIDYEGVENAHTPIGLNTTYKFNGEFDGQGHSIKNMLLISSTNGLGFFGFVRGGTVIRNLVIDSTCEISGAGQVGAIIGAVQTDAGTPLLIENCVNKATVAATGSGAGFIGAGQSAYPAIKLVNCLNAGDVSANPATAFCSWLNKGGSSLTNCVNTGYIYGMDNSGGKFSYFCNLVRYEPGTMTLTNCYDLSETEECGQGVEAEWLTDNPLAGGELCYQLNGDQSEMAWYQRIGTDSYPMPFAVEGGTVYANGEVGCDGIPVGSVTYSNKKETEIPPHDYQDGFCSNCGAPQADYAPQVDGVYQIGDASQVYWFSRMVNEYGGNTWNAQLTEDIDMDIYTDLFEPIGSSTAPYCGHFDGQGHRISNLIINTGNNYTGLFGIIGNGAVIENLLLDETCSIATSGECVALVGGAPQGGTVTMRNLGNMGNVIAGGKQAAGIFGANSGSKAKVIIENCFSTGAIQGSGECAAIAGWAGSNSPVVSNCWTCSEVSGNDRPDMYLVRHGSGVLTNLFSTFGEQGIIIDYENIGDGSLCYKLNGDQSAISWFQNIDNEETPDDQPVPFANGHARVYPMGKMLCDGTVDPTSVTYSNNNESVIPDHSFQDGFCTVCGQEDADFDGFVKVIKNPDFNVDAFAWNGTAPSVSNGIAVFSGNTFDTYQDIAGLQPGVYRLRVQGFSRSAEWTSPIYETGELEEDIMRNTYVYAETGGLRAARRLRDVTSGASDYKLNEGIGEEILANERFAPSTAAAASVYMGKGKYWNDLYFAVTSDTVRIGFSTEIASTAVQSTIDRLRLIYVGNDEEAYALIARQTADDAQDLDLLEGQENLKEEYLETINAAEDMTDPDEILAAADKASRYPNLIKLSVDAYLAYYAEIEKMLAFWEANSDNLIGDAADKIETYLSEEVEPSDEYPNGTYLYIKEYRLADAQSLAEEITRAQQMLSDAIKEADAPGMDITYVMANPAFTEAEWKGWNVTTSNSQSGWNMVASGGFTDVCTVAAGYNTAFRVEQQITGLRNGIYQLEAMAFHRPGEANKGLYDGTDVIPAKLFLNGYYTPVKSVYSDILDYADAHNGVNCRYDSTGDENAPHNGEQTGSKDIDMGLGLIPDNIYTASFAFNGGRYRQQAYAIVTDGTLNVGILNGESPWRNKNLTIWADFKLTYQGNSTEAADAILQQYGERLEMLELQRTEQDYHFSQAHVDNISSYISQAGTADIEEKMQLIAKINDEFSLIDSSVVIYDKLEEIYQYANDMIDGLEEGDQKDFMYNLFEEISEVLYTGSMTDDEARQKIDELMADKRFGGVIYVQGDLYDANSEGEAWDYSRMCTLYPLYQDADGKWTGSVTLQDRSRRANSEQRAGIYFRRINEIFKCATPNANFITPAHTTFSVQQEGSDFQALNGTYDITLDLEGMTVDFCQKDEYNWDNQVYVTGTLVNRSGAIDRWKNNEHWPLQHVGNGLYVGTVDMVLDNANPYCSFGIMACRSNTDQVNYSTTGRSSWTEARYGSSEQYLNISSGETLDSLVRGLDRTWRIAPAGRYLIEFDMNHATMRATLLDTKGRGTEDNPYLIANAADLQSMQDLLVDGTTTYFRLTDDIDLEGKGWYPLNSAYFGNSTECGRDKYVSLDGDGHVISNLTIPASALEGFEAGFFANLCGNVTRLGLLNVNLAGSKASATGVLAGALGSDTYEGTTTVSESYCNGYIQSDEAAGGIAGTVLGQASISNCYANACIEGDAATHGDLVGTTAAPLSITYSYGGGAANGSEAKGIVGEGQGSDTQYVLLLGDDNREELCQTVSAWSLWCNDGKAGNGYPILQWQADRGDAMGMCGYDEADPDAIDYVTLRPDTTGGHAYTLGGTVAGKGTRGIVITGGKKVVVK